MELWVCVGRAQKISANPIVPHVDMGERKLRLLARRAAKVT